MMLSMRVGMLLSERACFRESPGHHNGCYHLVVKTARVGEEKSQSQHENKWRGQEINYERQELTLRAL